MSEAVFVPPYPGWRILFSGMWKPGTYLRLTEGSRPGVFHFYRTFGIYGLLPVVLLNAAAIIGEGQSPEAWRFRDINPWTIVIAAAAQLVVGLLVLHIFSLTMSMGMSAVRLNSGDAAERVLKTGWYVGTTLYCLLYWWLGLVVFFTSLKATEDAVEPAITPALVVGMVIALRVALSAYRVNSAEGGGGTGVRAFLGPLLGFAMFTLVMIPVSFVFQLIVLAVLRG